MHTVESDINPYLQQEIMSASPVRLRWMLIQRARELTGMVQQLWSAGNMAVGNQWLLRIREIFGELLDGVKDETNPLSVPVSDFYLFLLQMSFEIERTQNAARLQVLAELLAIEEETWRMMVEKVGSESLGTSLDTASLDTAAASLANTSLANTSLANTSLANTSQGKTSTAPLFPSVGESFGASSGSSFSLEM